MNNQLSKTLNYKNAKIDIFYDEDARSPREDYNLSVMNCFHGKYNLGEKHSFNDLQELKEYLHKNKKNLEALPLFLYDHSGITMSTGSFNDRWDSGQVGYIYITRKAIKDNWPNEKQWRRKAKQILLSVVKSYDEYIRGEVYGYVITIDDNEIDACWGFIGSHEESGLLDEAMLTIDHEAIPQP